MSEPVNPMQELKPDGEHLITNSTLLKVGERYYPTKSLFQSKFSIGDMAYDTSKVKNFTMHKGYELNADTAYLIGDYYYLFRGNLSDVKGFENPKPGIYYDDKKCEYVTCDPQTDEEKAEYRYSDKITNFDAEEIRRAVLNKEVVVFNIPDSVHSSIPPEAPDEDILKRITKRALLAKGIDLDQCRTRFASKNMLFNYKSVLRGDNRLSMMLFERGLAALNLKFTVILEEAGGELVGRPLEEPLEISSDEVFSASPTAKSSEDLDEDESDFD